MVQRKSMDTAALNAFYRRLFEKAKELKSTISQESRIRFYNGHFTKNSAGEYEKEYFPIPEVEVKGLCDIEIEPDWISISAKMSRNCAVSYDFSRLDGYNYEIYGAENYLTDLMPQDIQNSDEVEIGMSFVFDFDIPIGEIARLVELLQQDGFYATQDEF